MSRSSGLCAVLIFISFVATAQTLVLNSRPKYDPRNFFHHFRDTTASMCFEEVRENPSWKKSKTLNFGFDQAAHWFYVDLRADSVDEFLLEVSFAPLDRIDLYFPAGDRYIRKTSGDAFPISSRDFEYQHPVFRFSLPEKEVCRIYLRVESTSSIQFPVLIWRRGAFSNHAIHVQIFNGVFYGAMMVMMLYQLFLFLSTRDRVSLYYVFTLFAMMHIVSYHHGYSFLYTYPENPAINKYMAILTGPVFLLFSTWLTRAFLDLKKNQPVIDKLIVINISVNILITVLMLFDVINVSYRVHHYAILIHSMLALTAAGVGIYHRFRPALYYLLSWLTLLFAALVFAISNLGFLGGFLNTTTSALIVACLVQMLLTSFALGNRWNNLVKENELSKEQEIKRKEIERANLEEEVRLRTQEIQLQNIKLEEVNRIKDKLFSVVSHDIKGPLTSLQLALSMTKNDTINQHEFRELASSLEIRFKQTTEFIENLLQWAKLQLKGESFDPEEVNLGVLVKSTLQLLESDIREKGIIVCDKVAEDINAYVDRNMLRLIMKNLLVNAIKFTSRDGVISVNAESLAKMISVSVRDTGTGIPHINRDKIFSLDIVTTPGTKQEKGTGLGLIICKEFVERNGGTIWFESEEGKGTVFAFTIPKHNSAEA
jgi:two-component system, sensor histidine kinase LadS